MQTFLIGLVILIVGGWVYGGICEKVIKPDDRKTPAFTKEDGVDFVPMKTWRNSLINLLNIAGTGPILGPIMGILFGPVAFILIPVGNILGGSMHDYFSGMLALRNNGMQMPALVERYTGKVVFNIYNIFICLLMLLVGAVFMYTPGDLMAQQIFGLPDVARQAIAAAASTPDAPVAGPDSMAVTWTLVIYGAIFIYYLCATLFPIDKIIGRIYPVFGAILLFSAVGIFLGLFAKGYQLEELSWANWKGVHPAGDHLLPFFFVTVACGIVSGFHSSQTAIISRSVTNERQGRMTFYNMMVLEGFIAMTWAAAAMGIRAKGAEFAALGAVPLIGAVCRDMLGDIGGIVAILGIIVLPITSGDTALRSLRLMIGDFFKIDQRPSKNRVAISAVIFAIVAGILWWSKMSPSGFDILWRYFAWSNQTLAVFAFAIITIYFIGKGFTIAPFMSLIPGAWYMFITTSYICTMPIGFGLPYAMSMWIGVGVAAVYILLVWRQGCSLREGKAQLEAVPVY